MESFQLLNIGPMLDALSKQDDLEVNGVCNDEAEFEVQERKEQERLHASSTDISSFDIIALGPSREEVAMANVDELLKDAAEMVEDCVEPSKNKRSTLFGHKESASSKSTYSADENIGIMDALEAANDPALDEDLLEHLAFKESRSSRKRKMAASHVREEEAQIIAASNQTSSCFHSAKVDLLSIYPTMEAADIAIRMWGAETTPWRILTGGNVSNRVYVCRSEICAFGNRRKWKKGQQNETKGKTSNFFYEGLEASDKCCKAYIQIQRVPISSLVAGRFH